MVTKVQKWGNSQGLRLSRQVLEDARRLLRVSKPEAERIEREVLEESET